MTWLDPDRWAPDNLNVETLATAALEAPRCECGSNICSGGVCCFCGRELRAEGSLSREYRRAAYSRRLQWARGAGLDARTGFLGLADEVGANPELAALDANLSARVEALVSPVEGDPFEGFEELIAA